MLVSKLGFDTVHLFIKKTGGLYYFKLKDLYCKTF